MAADDLAQTLQEARAALRARLEPSLERTLREALRDLDPLLRHEALTERLRRLARAAHVEASVSTASRIPAGAVLKSMVRKLTGWYVSAVVQQVNAFAFETSATLEAVALRLEALERRLEGLEPLAAPLRRPIRLPWPDQLAAALLAAADGLAPGARVLLADAAADPDTAIALTEHGFDVLGVTLDLDGADALAARGLEIRVVGLGELLEQLAPRSLAAAILRGPELEFASPATKRALLRAARRAVAGPLLVVWFEPAHLAADEALAAEGDLRPGPLSSGAWLRLLDEEGFDVVVEPLPGGVTLTRARAR